jgi:hypothetical protein
MAGSMAFMSGGSSLVSIAQAQPKPPAAQPKPQGAAPKPGAAPNIAEAKKHYGAGEKKFKEKDYAGALAEFQQADAIKSTAQATRYIGLCHEELGHFQDAVDSYEKFLANVPKGMDAQGDELKTRVAKIKAMPAKVHFETTPPGAQILIDDKPSGTTPADVDVTPGSHTYKLVLDKYDAKSSSFDLKFAMKIDVKETLTPKTEAPPPMASAVPTTAPPPTTPPPPPPPPTEARSMLPAYITGGLAVVAAGVGTIFGVIALGDKSDFDKNPTTSKADDGENHALIADMAFFVAVTLGVTSAVLFLTRDDAAPAQTAGNAKPKTADAKKKGITITPTPIITPTGGGAGAVIRF